MYVSSESQKKETRLWFENLRDQICNIFEKLEQNYDGPLRANKPGRFQQKQWHRSGGGGGVMSIMEGRVFEKVGVNISTVMGEFSSSFQGQIAGAEDDPRFWASGISVVAHMCSPFLPAVHMNTRHISTTRSWFGGGTDLTPTFPDRLDADTFHSALKATCEKYSPEYYPKFKKWCDEYFYLEHRKEPRGIGGIFFDQVDENFDRDFAFTKDIGRTFLNVFPKITKRRLNDVWSDSERYIQLVKRGRYVEFNLLYDRGTSFGLKTGGNIEAILMSLPPQVIWPAPKPD